MTPSRFLDALLLSLQSKKLIISILWYKGGKYVMFAECDICCPSESKADSTPGKNRAPYALVVFETFFRTSLKYQRFLRAWERRITCYWPMIIIDLYACAVQFHYSLQNNNTNYSLWEPYYCRWNGHRRTWRFCVVRNGVISILIEEETSI